MKLVGENTFSAKSQSSDKLHLVSKIGEDWKCECPDFIARQTPCKHTFACSFLPSLKVRVKQAVKPESPTVIVDSTVPSECIYCESKSVVKRGFAKEKGKKVQRFLCKECKRTFIPDMGFKGMKNDAKAITAALTRTFAD